MIRAEEDISCHVCNSIVIFKYFSFTFKNIDKHIYIGLVFKAKACRSLSREIPWVFFHNLLLFKNSFSLTLSLLKINYVCI